MILSDFDFSLQEATGNMAAKSSAGDFPRVTKLNIFPIKSCKALSVEEIEVDSYGVMGDRRLMLVDGNGRFISQRKFSKLATVSARFMEEEGEGEGEEVEEEEGEEGRKIRRGQKTKRMLCVSAPGMVRDLKFAPKLQGERRDVSVWQSEVRAIDQGDEAAQWFRDAIGIGSIYFRLVASAEGQPSMPQGDAFHRLVGNLPPTLKQRLPSMKMALADSGPVSLISSESLSDVNRRLEERGVAKVPLNRFRMNIEVTGCSRPFEEDEWLLVRIGTVPFLAYANAEVSKRHFYGLCMYRTWNG